MPTTLIEICVDTVAGVAAARDSGADRVELCESLWCGGLTPSLSLIEAALPELPPQGMQILVRSRPGDFVYTDHDVESMCRDMVQISATIDSWSASAPPYGFVVGALTASQGVDAAAARRFRESAGSHRLTFHRAFDKSEEKQAALDVLINLGYQRVLTTGGSSAVADVEGLARLVKHSSGRIVVLASGGLRSSNVARVVRRSGAAEVHMRAPLYAGTPEGTDPAEVARIVRALRGLR